MMNTNFTWVLAYLNCEDKTMVVCKTIKKAYSEKFFKESLKEVLNDTLSTIVFCLARRRLGALLCEYLRLKREQVFKAFGVF